MSPKGTGHESVPKFIVSKGPVALRRRAFLTQNEEFFCEKEIKNKKKEPLGKTKYPFLGKYDMMGL